MKAAIGDEDENGVGLRILDNNGVSHGIHVAFDGEITYHEQDGYADRGINRTREETEYGSQARRFAKWHVYRERGYETLPRRENPDSILAGLLAITHLSADRFEEYFGDVEAQLRSHYDGSSVDLPFEGVDPDDPIVYRKDLYLQPDPLTFDPPVLDQFRARFDGDSDSPVVPDAGEVAVETLEDLAFDVEAVSETHVLHTDGQGNEQVSRGEQPLEREPDARVELMAFDLDEIDSFQHYVVSNLAYQIRDRFLLLGVKPPLAFRARGWGSYDGFVAQKFCDLYEDYWSSEATISSWEPA